jgi:hypothetical protein
MIAGLQPFEILGILIASFFTLLVLSYAIGDNAAFRLAIYIFIGVSAGYAGAVAIRDVLVPQFLYMINDLPNNPLPLLFSLLWVGLILTKLFPNTAHFGNPASALLVGVGAAIAIAGAIQGTILPQISNASVFFQPQQMRAALQSNQLAEAFTLFFQGSIVLVGTLTSLISFHFSARSQPNQIPQRQQTIEWIARFGQVFVAIILGVIFAGIYSAALTALVERFSFLLDTLAILFQVSN